MTRPVRIFALCCAAALALVAAGCANKQEARTLAETEGLYLDLNELNYQVQMSRILNPASPEDRDYLLGLAEGVRPGADEVWFAIFLRVQNPTDEPLAPADRFKITDTQENTYSPVALDRSNLFAYFPERIPAGEVMPLPDTPAYNGPTRGSLLLFKVKAESLYNRPLELHIASTRGGAEGIVDLDV